MYCSSATPKTEVVFYLPASFDPEAVLPEHLVKFANYARWFVHFLYSRRVFDRRDADGFVPLMAKYLRRVLPKDFYKDIIESLVQSGVVECDGYWIKGEKAKGYRLTEKYRNETHARLVVEDYLLRKKLDGIKAERHQRLDFDVHRHLCHHLHELEIDFQGAARAGVLSKTEYRQVAEMIRDKALYFNVCEYGRVHTNLTNCPRVLRPFLRVGGSSLVNLDVSNSQPLLLCVLLLNFFKNGGNLESINAFHFDGNREMYFSFPDLVHSVTNSSPESPPIPHPVKMPLFASSPVRYLVGGIPEDVVEYVELTQNGKLYERLMAESDVPDYQRNEFKAEVLKVLYCEDHRLYDVGKVFERVFPNVMKAVTAIKGRDKKRLPTLLQRVESSLVVNRVVRRMMEQFPDKFVATIHDSVLCLPEDAHEVKRLIQVEYHRVGLYPTVKREDYRQATSGQLAC